MSAAGSRPVSVVVVSIGGYGHFYLETLLEEVPPQRYELVGAVDPRAQEAPLGGELEAAKVPVFDSLETFYAEGGRADLAVISSPLQLHAEQTLLALERGSHVLCEKPVATTVQDAEALARVSRERGRWVMVGYQWSWSSAIQELKRDIMGGLFGAPLRLATLTLWPRDAAYYRRNDWAGRVRDDAGRWVLDSPASNAMAHFLHNQLYVLGDGPWASTRPSRLTAEVCRAHPIESYDTVACRIRSVEDVELLFYASHAGRRHAGPMFRFECEEAVISYGEESREIVATDVKGVRKRYPAPDSEGQFTKLFAALDAVGEPGPPACDVEAATPHVVCVNGIQESVAEIPGFPGETIRKADNQGRLWVEGLDETLHACYEQSVLPSELGCSWARRGRSVDLGHYHHFPAGDS